VKRLAQLEPRGVGHLPGLGGSGTRPSAETRPTNQLFGDEAHNHAVATRLGVDLDVFVAPGGV